MYGGWSSGSEEQGWKEQRAGFSREGETQMKERLISSPTQKKHLNAGITRAPSLPSLRIADRVRTLPERWPRIAETVDA